MAGPVPLTAERARWIAAKILPHEPTLRSLLRKWRLPDGLEADDVIQESYARLASVDDFSRIQTPSAYFFSAARMVVLGYIRRQRVVSIQALEAIDHRAFPVDEPSPHQQVSDRQQFALLADMVAALPPPGPEIMRLRMIEELNHRDIGERLGLSTNAVQKLLARNLAKFAEALGRGGLDGSGASNPSDRDEVRNEIERARD